MSDNHDPVALARRLAEEAKARAAGASAAPTPQAKTSLLSRAPKPLSPQEALQKAIAEEAKREAVKDAEDANRRAAVEHARQLADQARRTAPARAEHTLPPVPMAKPTPLAPPAPKISVDELVGQRLPGFEISSTHPVTSAEAFKGVWTSNRVRAALDEDYGLLVTADLLLDAASRVGAGGLVGLRVEREGAAWALFVDAERGVLLALLPRPEIYLAGL